MFFIYPTRKVKFYLRYDVDFHEIIENLVLEYKQKGSFLVCGDLNSRIGVTNDILPNDNLDRYVDSVEHVENPMVPNRHSRDRTINSFGRKLIQLCQNTGLTTANGWLGNDTEGKFTFCTMRGSSVNDYLLISPDDYKLIKDFDVLDFNEFSDHAPLYFEFDLSNIPKQHKYPKIRSYVKWDSSRTNEFVEIIHYI